MKDSYDVIVVGAGIVGTAIGSVRGIWLEAARRVS